jgi:DNA invertase Pin-like site-specific DNA recombinase
MRQSDHKADEDHVFSRESQLKLTQYAQRLRGDTDDAQVLVYDEGAGVSGQKRIDQRVELNRLYNDIKHGQIGSLVVMHEDRLFRDQYHTNDTTFIRLLAQYDVLLFVRTDNRRYDCTKSSDRNSLLEKMIASRNYLDDHVLGRMNGSQQAKALQGLFDGRNLPMGYVTQGKKKQQTLIIYEPWARVVRWMFARLRELDSFPELCREIEVMPYLFPNPAADDLLRYTFKIRMTKVPGGFKPTSVDAIKYMLCNPTYMGAWVYEDAIVNEDNHAAIVDRELFIWAYHKLTGRNLQGEWLEGRENRRQRSGSAQAVLRRILRVTAGVIYVMHPATPQYIHAVLVSDPSYPGMVKRRTAFAIAVNVIDDIFLSRVKELAASDSHLGGHLQASIDELEQQHTEAVISVEEHLTQVRLELQKTMALVYDNILSLTPQDKAKYNAKLLGLREREDALLSVQEESTQAVLQSDLDELGDVLADIPARLDACSLTEKQKLARLITESVTIEELSPHWLRLTVVWRGSLADHPDVCLIWCQRGRHSEAWTAEEDEYLRAHYSSGDKWTMLQDMPSRSWNMIYKRANKLGMYRTVVADEGIPQNVCVDDLAVIPDPDLALELVTEAGKQRARGDPEGYGVWLYSARLEDAAAEIDQRNANSSRWPS